MKHQLLNQSTKALSLKSSNLYQSQQIIEKQISFAQCFVIFLKIIQWRFSQHSSTITSKTSKPFELQNLVTIDSCKNKLPILPYSYTYFMIQNIFFWILILKFKFYIQICIKNFKKQSRNVRLNQNTIFNINAHNQIILQVLLLCMIIPLISSNLANCNSQLLGVCIQCDDYYSWNSGTFQCQGCQDSDCKQCLDPSSMNVCQACSDGYYRNSVASCTGCSLPFCQTCDFVNGSVVVTSCATGYVVVSGACQTCSSLIPNCTACSSTSICSACNDGYTVKLDHTGCQTCNQTIAGCTKCDSPSICKQCNTVGYYLPSGGNRCALCANSAIMTNCYSCQNTGAYCIACQANFTFNGNSLSCYACGTVYSQCQTCNTSACVSCISGWGLSSGSCYDCTLIFPFCSACTDSACIACISTYFMDGSCTLCSSIITNCSTCSNSSICQSCIAKNGINDLGACQSCSTMMVGCLDCSVNASCISCDYSTGYYRDSATKLCSLCSSALSLCFKCQTNTSCDQCISGYAPNNSFYCQPCIKFLSGCSTCTNNTSCLTCISNSFYFNTTDSLCHYCNSSQFQCKQCTFEPDLTIKCTKCQSGFHLDTQKQCICDLGKLVNGFCIDVNGCVNTTNGTACTACEVGMTLRHQKCVCQDNYWLVNDVCTNVAGCIAIQSFQNGNKCIFCNITQQFQIGNDNQCHCKVYYQINNNSCQEICGDGVLISYPCDDGNTISGDGCSSKCQIESGFKCYLDNQSSHCIYSSKFVITLVKIERFEGKNSGRFVFEFTPAVSTLSAMNWTKYLNLSIPNASFNITGSTYSNGFLEIRFDYGSNLQGLSAELSISFDPKYFSSGTYNLTFPITTDGLQFSFLLKLQIYKIIDYIFLCLGILALLIFMVSLPFHKMLGIETLHVFQVYFLCLILIDSYDEPFNRLYSLRYTLGLVNLWKYSSTVTKTNYFYTRLGVVYQFFQNNIIISFLSLFLAFYFFIYFIKLIAFLQDSKDRSNSQKSSVIRCSTLYKSFLFPFVIGFSFLGIVSLYSQAVTQLVQAKVSKEVNFCLILAFFLTFGSIFWAEIVIPLQQISKEFLSITHAKKWYVSEYLLQALMVICIIVRGCQGKSLQSLLLLSLVACIQVLLTIIRRPYVFGIHNLGIVVNELAILAVSLSLAVRNIRLSQGYLFQQEDNFQIVSFLMILLALVDALSLLRLIFEIKRKCNFHNDSLKPPSEQILQQKMLKTFRGEAHIEIENYNPSEMINKYLVENQKIQFRNMELRQIQKQRVLSGVQQLDFDLKRKNRPFIGKYFQ